jgi:hypothetical protein
MNSNDVATNSENVMKRHVLDVALEARNLLAQGFYKVFTHGDGIW